MINSDNNGYLIKFAVIGMIFLVTIILVWNFSNNGMSLSVDLAHHYTLVEKIARDGGICSGYAANLGEMSMYSPGAHYMSAFFQAFTGSGILSMNIISLLSIVLTYFVIGYFLIEFNIIAFILGCVCCFVFSIMGDFPIIGREVVGHYFFAQIVAQAFLIVFLVPISRIELSDVCRVVIFSVALIIGYYIHPTFTVIFWGATLLMLLLGNNASRSPKSHYLYWGLYLLAGLVIFWYHPYGRSMAKIAENNGWLFFSILTKSNTEVGWHGYMFMGLCILFSLAIIIAIFLDRFKCKSDNALLTVNSILFSASAMAILQRIVLEFGMGSLYAVKKYFFVMFTFFIITLTMVVSALIERNLPVKLTWFDDKLKKWKYALIVILPILIVPPLFSHPVFKVNEVVKIQKQARYFHEFVANSSEFHNVLAQFAIPSTLNYLISIGDMEFPRGKVALAVLRGKSDEIPDNIFILSENMISHVQPVKTVGRNYFYRSMDFNSNAIESGDIVLFNNAISKRWLKHGFSSYETWGTWSDGPESDLTFKISEKQSGNPIRVLVQVHPWLVKGHERFGVIAICQGLVLGHWDFDINKGMNTTELEMVVPVNQIKEDGTIEIIFKYDNLKSPRALGLSSDSRELSLGFEKMTVYY